MTCDHAATPVHGAIRGTPSSGSTFQIETAWKFQVSTSARRGFSFKDCRIAVDFRIFLATTGLEGSRGLQVVIEQQRGADEVLLKL